MSKPTYVSRGELMTAADVAASARFAPQLDRILQGVSRQIDKTMHREFFPTTATKTFFPEGRVDHDTKLWSFAVPDLLSVSSITVDTVALTSAQYRYLDLDDFGAPYDQVALIGVSGTEIVAAGDWGYTNSTSTVGTLVGAVNDVVQTVVVSNSAAVSPGDMIGVATERMIVVEAGLADTGQNIGADIAALTSADVVAVTTGSAYFLGETIVVGSERMTITSIAGNTLIVERAAQGSTLAAHVSGADIYAPRSLTVERGATGSTAASQSADAAVTRFLAPPPIRSLALGMALVGYEQEKGAYGRVVGSGDGQREASGKGLWRIEQAAAVYRRVRVATV